MPQLSPTIEDLEDACRRIAGDVIMTPLIRSDALDEVTGARVFVKAECLQVTGAFKVRGAYNRLRQFTSEEARGGVVSWSSGNHGQAIAAAARRIGMPALVLMPHDSVATKVKLTRGYGAEIEFFERGVVDATVRGVEIAAARDATIVPPANDRDVIAGQGTATLEILGQLAALGAGAPDVQLVPCGSGGLTAGAAIALSARSPRTALFAVEPEGFDDTGRSLAAGIRLAIEPGRSTLCDALTARTPAPMTFEVNRILGVKALTVSDEEVRRAMAFAFRYLKLVMEPGGAAALAALLANKIDVAGKIVTLICSGGNVEASVFADAITREV